MDVQAQKYRNILFRKKKGIPYNLENIHIHVYVMTNYSSFLFKTKFLICYKPLRPYQMFLKYLSNRTVVIPVQFLISASFLFLRFCIIVTKRETELPNSWQTSYFHRLCTRREYIVMTYMYKQGDREDSLRDMAKICQWRLSQKLFEFFFFLW